MSARVLAVIMLGILLATYEETQQERRHPGQFPEIQRWLRETDENLQLSSERARRERDRDEVDRRLRELEQKDERR
jgi:hypothetical protein